MGHCLGLHYGLDCDDGVQYPACGKRACVRACVHRCVHVWQLWGDDGDER